MKRIIAVIGALAICMSSFAIAADKDYSFNLNNTGTNFTPYRVTSSKKIYIDDDATIKATNNSTALGNGFLLKLVWVQSEGNYPSATTALWFNPNETGKKHPEYLPYGAVYNRSYHVAARIDDDYYKNSYISGTYNADYTK